MRLIWLLPLIPAAGAAVNGLAGVRWFGRAAAGAVACLASNFLVMFIGWEGVGLCSYLLIGYWYEKGSAATAGRKAFITNRIGDWGFLLGVFGVFSVFGTFDFHAVAQAVSSLPIEQSHF